MQNSQAAELYRQAQKHLSERDQRRAKETLLRALQLDPQYINAYRLLADIHVAESDTVSARGYLEQALAQLQAGSGRHTAVSLHLASLHLRDGDLAAAAAALDVQAALAVNDIRMLARAGYLFTRCEKHRDALALYEKALALQPRDPQLLYNCAAANRAMGNLARAELLYERVIELAPEDWEAYRDRSELRKQSAQSNHIGELRQLLQREHLPERARVQLNFALAKELEDVGDYPASFEALARGCAARRAAMQYSVEPDLQGMEEIARVFGAERLGRLGAAPERGCGLIFVLGMPRTGTTLVERLLTMADGVVSAGEPDTFSRLLHRGVQRIAVEGGGFAKRDFVAAAADVDLAQIGADYAGQMRRRAEQLGGRVIVDKNPMNFLYLGLIAAALPSARIVHLCRGPMDSCYAILKTLFKSAYPFSYDQLELGRYYLGYRKLMAHWHSALPGAIYDLHYEKLVADPAGESRRLFEFCGLAWTESVLDFHRREKQGTATASAAQVRQPVYRSSVGKWKNYRGQLQPLVEILTAGGIEVE